MQATATRPKTLEMLAQGGIADMFELQDEIVQHGDDVWFSLAWQDQGIIPEMVALELEPKLREIGCVPAGGQPVMVTADPDNLRVWVNYREQTPELGMIIAVIGGLSLLSTGASFFLFRERTEAVLGENFNMVIIITAAIGALLLGGGTLLALNEGRSRGALRAGR